MVAKHKTSFKINLSRPYKVALLILLLVIVGAWVWYTQRTETADTSTPPTTGPVNKAGEYSPPTQEEQAAGDQQKEENVARENSVKPPKTANLVISNTSQSGDTVRIRTFVSNQVETGGTCTTTLTKDSLVVTKQTTAFADASSTQCGAIDFSRQQFTTAGQWNVKVRYQSSTLSGEAVGTITIN